GEAQRDGGAGRRRARRYRRVDHGWPILGRDARTDDRPHRPRGRPWWSDRARRGGRSGRHRRRQPTSRSRRRAGRSRRATRSLGRPRPALHGRGHGQVRRARLVRVRWRRDDRSANVGRAPANRRCEHHGNLCRDRDHRGMTVRIGFKTSPQDVDWATIDATWARAGRLADEPGGGFDSARLNDHLTNLDAATPGPSLEALTLLAALIHHVPGLTVGHAVLSNTFRHPVLLAKAAVVLDHATGGRFVLGLGAGWYDGEHLPFGIELPPIGPRIDRL